MCGRITLSTPTAILESIFPFAGWENYFPSYNIAPSQTVMVLIREGAGAPLGVKPRRWGLLPHWAKDRSLANKLSNARAKGIAQKPSFRLPFRQQRCLFIVDGFYEWQARGREKWPYYFYQLDREPFTIAGLHESWHSPTETILTACLITTVANGLVRPIHERMPVILPPDRREDWLDPQNRNIEALEKLLLPLPDNALQKHPVSRAVNRAGVNEPGLIAPLESPFHPLINH